MGGVKPLTGVNLDEDEWAMLTSNFDSIKDFLGGNQIALRNVFIPPKEIDERVKVYRADWYLKGKLVNDKKLSKQEFYTREAAELDADDCLLICQFYGVTSHWLELWRNFNELPIIINGCYFLYLNLYFVKMSDQIEMSSAQIPSGGLFRTMSSSTNPGLFGSNSAPTRNPFFGCE